VLLWTGLAVGLGAAVLDRSMLTWGFGAMAPVRAMAVYAVLGPVLMFLEVAGAVVCAVCVVVLVVVPRERSAPREDPAEAEEPAVDVEPLPSTEDVDLGEDDFRASYRVDFAGRWGGRERFRVTGTQDVRAVIAWAQGRADGRVFEVWVEHATAEGVTQIRLAQVPADTVDA
jgi:hypothetical protein